MNLMLFVAHFRWLVLPSLLCLMAACASGEREAFAPPERGSAGAQTFILYRDTLAGAVVAEAADKSEAFVLSLNDAVEAGDFIADVDCADDGSQAAYVISNESGSETRLFIAGADGSKTIDVSGLIRGLDWAQDGERIAVAVLDPVTSQHQIVVVDVSSGQTEVLTSGSGPANSPRWSPDGGAIAYWAFDGRTYQVFVLRLGESGPKKVTNRASGAFYPDWSAGGGIVFAGVDENSIGQLFAVSPTGEGAHQFTTSNVAKTLPRSSPDRSQMAFVGTIVAPQISIWPLALHNVGVFTVAPDGTDERQFTDLAKDALLLGWCMPGQWLDKHWSKS